MKILAFNRSKGIYSFEINNFQTESHAHPVMEIILATQGQFSLKVSGRISEKLTFAVIAANLKHQLIAQDCELQLLMLEHKNEWTTAFLQTRGIVIEDGIFTSSSNYHSQLFNELKALAASDECQQDIYDDRVQQCLLYINQKEVSYRTIVEELKSEVHLSDSRLSHLFRQEIGLSLKKYLVWSRLKKTIQLVLGQGVNLSTAAIRSGFYDQAHLSKTFKNMLGVSPSEAYNSRMLQE